MDTEKAKGNREKKAEKNCNQVKIEGNNSREQN